MICRQGTGSSVYVGSVTGMLTMPAGTWIGFIIFDKPIYENFHACPSISDMHWMALMLVYYLGPCQSMAADQQHACSAAILESIRFICDLLCSYMLLGMVSFSLSGICGGCM